MVCTISGDKYLPYARQQERTIEKGKAVDPNYPDWKDLTEPAKDLIRKLLCPDPLTRIGATEALSHPWISEREKVANRAHRPKSLEQLKQFNAKKKWAAALSVVQWLASKSPVTDRKTTADE